MGVYYLYHHLIMGNSASYLFIYPYMIPICIVFPIRRLLNKCYVLPSSLMFVLDTVGNEIISSILKYVLLSLSYNKPLVMSMNLPSLLVVIKEIVHGYLK